MKDLIARKGDGKSLTTDEWSYVVAAYVAGEIPDYQMAALLMATYANGMEGSEFTALADAMPGDAVAGGQAIASVYAAAHRRAEIGLAALTDGLRIAPEPPASVLPLVSHRVSADGVEVLS